MEASSAVNLERMSIKKALRVKMGFFPESTGQKVASRRSGFETMVATVRSGLAAQATLLREHIMRQ